MNSNNTTKSNSLKAGHKPAFIFYQPFKNSAYESQCNRFCTAECRTEQESPDNRQGLYEKEYGLSAPSSLRRSARTADRAGFDRSERFQSPPELFRTESSGTGRQHDPGRADPCRYAPSPAATGRKATRSYAAKGVFARPDWRDGRPYGLRSAQ